MEVIKVVPRGYCYGVVDAVQMARKLAQDPNVKRPILSLGAIVHNHYVVEDLSRIGIETLEARGKTRMELLEDLPGTGGTLLLTAHGVSPSVRAHAESLGFDVVDATCPDVERTHEVVRRLTSQGFEILYVGKKGHPEPEGAIGEGGGHVHLVESAQDLDAITLPDGVPLAVTTQTTLSLWDTADVIAAIRKRYPQVEVFNEICRATQDRQEAATKAAEEADVVIVVGDRTSNNTMRLVDVVGSIAHRPAFRVDGAADIDPAWLRGAKRVAVTAGSSTPTQRTREVIQFLEGYEPEAVIAEA